LPLIALPKKLPAKFQSVVEVARLSVVADLPKILDPKLTLRKLFDQTPAFMGRYFWMEDALTEVEHFDRAVSAIWAKVTGGHCDDSSLLTLLLCVAAGSAPKTLLTEKAASALIRKIRKSGIDPAAASTYVQTHAPEQTQDDYLHLWDHFIEDAKSTLQSDMDYALNDAMALLRRECNVS